MGEAECLNVLQRTCVYKKDFQTRCINRKPVQLCPIMVFLTTQYYLISAHLGTYYFMQCNMYVAFVRRYLKSNSIKRNCIPIVYLTENHY